MRAVARSGTAERDSGARRAPQLMNFVLLNIFVAIIVDAHTAVLDENPEAKDSSKFIAMVWLAILRPNVFG